VNFVFLIILNYSIGRFFFRENYSWPMEILVGYSTGWCLCKLNDGLSSKNYCCLDSITSIGIDFIN
jgi:hypothetical protein